MELFSSLSCFQDEFYLAGGTGLALQLGHRVSVDFDLFSLSTLKRNLLRHVEETYSQTSPQLLVSNRDELSLIISGVKFTFLYYPFPVIMPFDETGPIPILSAQEILATKAYTIGRRGEFKDYVDVYCGLRENVVSLRQILSLADQKYGDAFNSRLFLEQLVYLDDIVSSPLTMKSQHIPSKEELLGYFTALIRRESPF